MADAPPAACRHDYRPLSREGVRRLEGEDLLAVRVWLYQSFHLIEVLRARGGAGALDRCARCGAVRMQFAPGRPS